MSANFQLQFDSLSSSLKFCRPRTTWTIATVNIVENR